MTESEEGSNKTISLGNQCEPVDDTCAINFLMVVHELQNYCSELKKHSKGKKIFSDDLF